MSPTVDFTDWAQPDLVLTLGGRTYTVRPPSVDRARLLLAFVVRAEHRLGLVTGPLPRELEAVLVEVGETPLGVYTLGQDVYEQLVADGAAPVTIERMAYYALHYWARGQQRADAVATWLWAPEPEAETEAPTQGKGRRRSRSRSGRSTG